MLEKKYDSIVHRNVGVLVMSDLLLSEDSKCQPPDKYIDTSLACRP